ncbi:TRAP transporter large permease [Cumulibacter soli]|uniref:TRAP transporter large permease n=1 Tax=Cumulibacter soli TaxID=2546344 RepID=UPI001067A657|nr:TRAP transporter large permease [Cumulibacter soli]
MAEGVVITIVVVGFLLLLASGYYIHSVLAIAGVLGLLLLDGAEIWVGLVGPGPFGRTAAYTLTTIPLFVLMAQFVLQADVVKDLFYVVNKVSRNRKSVLGSLTLVAGAGLGAVSGSGTASAASLGQVAVPELERSGFKPAFAGALAAAAGAMSGIIPPAIGLILYGVATETPIGELFIAAIIPGILCTVVFILAMMFYLRRAKREDAKAAAGGEEIAESELPEAIGVRRVSVAIAVSVLIIAVVFGGIYSGTVTPTEAGAVGSLVALIAAFVLGKVNLAYLKRSFLETIKVTAMVMLILIGAQIFGKFVSLSLIPRKLVSGMEPLMDQKALVLIIFALIFFVLFMFIEGAAVVLMTVPVMLPVMQTMGIDLIWFGVFVSVIGMIGMITPPVGLSVYAVSGATGISSDRIFKYSLGFAVIATIVMTALLVIFPELATWLPTLMG